MAVTDTWTTYPATFPAVPRKLRRQPSNETGLYLHTHKHNWVETGTHTWPSGDVDPTFRCTRCGDVICTTAVIR